MTDSDPPVQGEPTPAAWIAPSAESALPPVESALPPGWTPIESPPIDYGLPRPSEIYGYQPPPSYANPLAAHKPGIIPLRPLTVGDVLNGSFTAVTTNLRAVAAISAVIALAGTLVTILTSVMTESVDVLDDNALGALGGITTFGFAAAVALSAILTGALAYPTSRAVEGRYPPIARCWKRIAPRLPAILVLAAIQFVLVALPFALLTAVFASATTVDSLSVVVLGIVIVLIAILALSVVWTFIAFALPITVLEKLGPIDSLRRSIVLVRPVFWRVFGILLLVGVIIGIAGSVLMTPADTIGSMLEEVAGGASATTAKIAVSTIMTAIVDFVTLPFLATNVTVLYTDTRIRLEGFDITLMTASDVTSKGAR
ncbi:hypothetical protein GOEFS_080_00040 [Gordonia effusa NBRC 100432]|uniref:DUF7847 domain-containing protein n=1 Tax=Gordonia effusa NBRC 100432 TaxID=1077974 RepID=H0R2J1_9ACTN|nr:hypothetical protein [Gordonia effusa]GAB19292.1 hypothetical protein GOEFS_080_00040 [Gordonia effusa NBRC 100432]